MAAAFSRRTFCLVGMIAVAVCRFGKQKPGETGSRPLTLSSLIGTSRAAAHRLGGLCVEAFGATAAAALVREQEHRLLQEAREEPRRSLAALIGADYRANRTVDIDGLRLSRFEAAVLVASHIDELARSGHG